MTLDDVREKYLSFFKARGHAVIPSSPLVPENDPTTLFTGSGMQPLVPYLLGREHPSGARLVDSQKCFRSGDIEEVGDNRHTTFFEMLGNWSLGDYFKAEQLPWFFEFLTKEIGLDPARLYVTVFAGDETLGIPADSESVAIWKTLFKSVGIDARDVFIGSEEAGGERGMQGGRIFYYDAKKNWWSRSGVPSLMPAGEPGGPDSEVFYDFGTPHNEAFGKECHVNCDCGRFLEIGNSVFMQYQKQADGSFLKLPKQNVDFGGGLERIVMAGNHNPDIIAINHAPLIAFLEIRTGKTYGVSPMETRAFRVIADHMKAAVFLIGDGVLPSNTDQGYFVRRLIRRSVRFADTLGMREEGLAGIVAPVCDSYQAHYPELYERREHIHRAIEEEEKRFRQTLKRALREFDITIRSSGVFDNRMKGETVVGLLEEAIPYLPGSQAFKLVTTYGFPKEMIEEEAKMRGIVVDWESFKAEMAAHQTLSRAGAEQKFKGGLADRGEVTTMLHSATHLMLAALRKELGPDVHQAGSNITSDRTRFDFTYPEKVSREILDCVEAYVNEAIQKKCPMRVETMKKEEARAAGVEGSFWEKYPEEVTVYSFVAPDGTVYSRELCGGPHVANTGDIQGVFKIIKEEASSAGVRRIKGVISEGLGVRD